MAEDPIGVALAGGCPHDAGALLEPRRGARTWPAHHDRPDGPWAVGPIEELPG